MSFSPEWETWYKSNDMIEGWSPKLLKLIACYIFEADKILEFGSGSGGVIPFITAQGWRYHGLDGSATAIGILAEKYHNAKFACVDFTTQNPFGGGFDAAIDRASIAHNDIDGIKRAVNLVWDCLKPGGIFISSDWFSANHSEKSREHYPDGQFVDVGHVHFSSEEELTDLFKDFDRIHIEERITRLPASGCFLDERIRRHNISPAFDEYQSAVWDIVVRKPHE